MNRILIYLAAAAAVATLFVCKDGRVRLAADEDNPQPDSSEEDSDHG